jgi:nucleotide-binding universal stress UspA family protein
MSERPVVVGVDNSEEAAKAAVLAHRVAQLAHARCKLVTATPNPWGTATLVDTPLDFAAFERDFHEAARQGIAQLLADRVAAEIVADLVIRSGRPAKVVEDYAHEVGAGLIVLGGKHHIALERWVGGSTAHHVLRKLDIPLLVTGSGGHEIRRVLAAVDLSFAARPTLEQAQTFAKLFNARLWVLHVIAPLPMTNAFAAPFATEDLASHSATEFEEEIWPAVELADAEKAVRRGPVVDTIVDSAERWHADLVVVGSHGKGWTDRLLLGSTTEKLLDKLPTHLLVTPVSRA